MMRALKFLRPNSHTRRQIRGWLIPGIGMTIAIAFFVWVISNKDQTNARSENSNLPGIVHVHGLGVDPADDSLYVATHYGMFRVKSKRSAERVGESFQDTMGFTVVGPNEFVGSGHPDLAGSRDGQPNQLGLIESSDSGRSWKEVSLGGDVDFHSLVSAHGLIYGLDSRTGRFMVSENRKQWDERSTFNLISFAVDPQSADHIIGAGESGLIESTDGGRNWTTAAGPNVIVLSWNEANGLWGADPQGVVWKYADGSWQPGGELSGSPQAFLATDTTLWAAAGDNESGQSAIYRSDDLGVTWTKWYEDDTT